MASSSAIEALRAAIFDPEPLNFWDDDPLPSINVNQTSSTSAALPIVSMTAMTERRDVMASESCSEFTVLLWLKAPSMRQYAHPLKRAPIDLVMVLDIGEGILDHVKNVVRFVINNMCPSDRLSIVSCTDNARRLLPLRTMDESGKEDAGMAVSLLFITEEGPTNYVEALWKAAKVLQERRQQNPVTNIILLTDSTETCTAQPDGTSTDPRDNPDYQHLFPDSIYPRDRGTGNRATFPVYAFGIGPDHNPLLLHAVSSASGGTYSFVGSSENLKDAIASCIGGLLSVVTQDFHLMVARSTNGVNIKSISSGQFYSSISDSGSIGEIEVGDLYADELKQFLIHLSLPEIAIHGRRRPARLSRINIMCSYSDAVSEGTLKGFSIPVDIHRPIYHSSPEDNAEGNIECRWVIRQKTHLYAAESIKAAQRMADAGDVFGARALLSNRISSIPHRELCLVNRDVRCQCFYQAMCATEARMATEQSYAKGGQAYALSTFSSLDSQRATTRGYEVLEVAGAYICPFATPALRSMVAAAAASIDE